MNGPQVLATIIIFMSSVKGLTGSCTPRQIHLSYGKTTSEMTVVWSTAGQCPSTVRYGEIVWQLIQNATGQSVADGLKYVHRVQLTQLLPDKTYYYLPSNETLAYSYYFKTPSINEPNEVELLLVSEISQSSPAIQYVKKEAQRGSVGAILHTGNIPLHSNNGTGEDYMDKMEFIVSAVPYLVAPGPKDQEDGSFSQYLQTFSMPGTDWPMTLDKIAYSLDIGAVHLISFSTEVFYLKDDKYSSNQRNWLIKDLEAANKNRKNVPWLIAFGSRPFYCTYESPENVCIQKNSKIKSGLEDIFFHYGVDLIIQSYGAAYERTFPLFKNVATSENYTNPTGPVYIIAGSGSSYNLTYNFTEPAPDWSAFRLSNVMAVTIGHIRVVNASTLEYEQVNVQDGQVLDSFKIEQEHHGMFSVQNLSSNIAAQVDKNIVDSGGKSGTLDINESKAPSPKSRIEELLEADNKLRIIIGGACGGVAIVLISLFIFVKKCKRKSKVTRRWEQMDINYGKKFYSKAPEKDEDNDFEIDMSDGTEPTRKLLNADN